MTTLARSIALLGLGAVFGGCAAKQAPPVQRYALGMSRAEYRDYAGAKASPCDAEPRWFQDELTAVNGLLARFIKETEQAMDPKALEHAKQLALLEEGLRTLPPVLKVHEANLQALKACDFRRAGAFPDLAQRGATLLTEARDLMALGPRFERPRRCARPRSSGASRALSARRRRARRGARSPPRWASRTSTSRGCRRRGAPSGSSATATSWRGPATRSPRC
ncbi:hypothetical protein [Corallococcus sp. 4LFB]|uniref:hypothetical protein n=1 Tax=Corallococcus sp. 4LFB TaxID=3383249 RepID=UPI0039753148